METPETKSSRFKVRHVWKYLVTLAIAAVALSLYFRNRSKAPKNYIEPTYVAFLNIDKKGRVSVIYDLKIRNASSLVSGKITSVSASIRPQKTIDSNKKIIFLGNMISDDSQIVEFEQFDVYPNKMITKPIKFQQDTNKAALVNLKTGRNLLEVVATSEGNSNSIFRTYYFNLKPEDIQNINKIAKDIQSDSVDRNVPIHLYDLH